MEQAICAALRIAPIEQITLSDCNFAGVQNPNVIADVKNIFLDSVRIHGKLVS